MKVRIGYGLGTRNATVGGERFRQLVDGLEETGFDSLWLSERISGNCPDPLVGMAYAVARTDRLKVGMSVLVLPGRNPVVLAKAIASLDVLSEGRVLPAFGLGIADSAEHQAFGVQRKDRGGWFNEALPLLRRLWAEEEVSHVGKRFTLDGVTIQPRPIQKPIEVWLGGIAPLELKRVGRLADGWLPSFCLPEQVAQARVEIERVATEHDRQIDPEHFGALIPYRSSDQPLPATTVELLERRNPGVNPDRIIPHSEDLPATIKEFLDVGFSKFVLVPVVEPDDWASELHGLAATVLPLQT